MLENNMKIAENNKIIEYTPESPILHPMQLLKTMLADLRSSFGLAYRLTARDISATYRQTALGYFWAVFPPLVTSLTFILLNKANIMRVEDITIPYPLFVITGTIFWQLFVDALNAPLKVLNLNRAMLTKINFPKEALIISGITQVIFSFVIKLVFLACALVLFQAQLKWTVLFLPLPVMGLLTIGTVVGIFIVPMGMLYQDIQQALTICTSSLMFFTPVLYPGRANGIVGNIIKYNPITPFFTVCREMLFFGQLDSIFGALIIFGVALILILVGWTLYKLAMPILIERMES